MVVVEYSTFEVTLTKGTNITDQALGTVGGAVIEVNIRKETRTQDDKTRYIITVIHNATGSTILQVTKRQISVARGTASSLDNALATTGAATVTNKADVLLLESNETNILYDVLLVHPST